jgi:hypothetical protein
MKDGTQKVALGQGGAQQHPDLHEPSRDEYSGFSDDSESESVAAGSAKARLPGIRSNLGAHLPDRWPAPWHKLEEAELRTIHSSQPCNGHDCSRNTPTDGSTHRESKEYRL